MVSGYYGRLLWQPQVSVRASISHSVGERAGWREEPAERRRVEKSAEELRCGNKYALGVGKGRGRGEEQMWRRKKRWTGCSEGGCEGEKVMVRCERWGETEVSEEKIGGRPRGPLDQSCPASTQNISPLLCNHCSAARCVPPFIYLFSLPHPPSLL